MNMMMYFNQGSLQNRERILDFERKSSEKRKISNAIDLKLTADSLLGRGAEAMK